MYLSTTNTSPVEARGCTPEQPKTTAANTRLVQDLPLCEHVDEVGDHVVDAEQSAPPFSEQLVCACLLTRRHRTLVASVAAYNSSSNNNNAQKKNQKKNQKNKTKRLRHTCSGHALNSKQRP